MKMKAGVWRVFWMLLALGGMAVIYPWRSVDNAAEVAEVQMLVDEMSAALDLVAVGNSDVEDFTTENDGFAGFETVTPAGNPAEALIGQIGDNCIILHWTQPDIAQVGRLPGNQTCNAAAIDEIPVRPNDGYVPGTGPPFDVTPLIREAHTPAWFVGGMVVLVWLTIKAGLDLFLIFQRPDYFFSDR